MHFRVISVKRGKAVHRYAQIVERTYENGKAKNHVIKHLGPVYADTDIEEYRKAFLIEKRKNEITHANLEDLDLMAPMEFGVTYASRIILDDLGILAVFRKYLGSWADTLLIMVAARLFKPSSDHEFLNIFNRTYYPWSTADMGRDKIYRMLDKIEKNRNKIETDIFSTLKPDTSTVHYDLTSTYFEGREDNDLVLFGYSRDKKRGKEQIVIGLVMADGIPIHHEVWPGNTVDPKTLESTLSTLKDQFHIKNVIFIGDRAFGRSKSLGILDQNLFITAAYRWDNPYRDILLNTDFSNAMKSGDLLIKEVSINTNDLIDENAGEDERNLVKKRRHIAVYNKEREKLDIADLEEKISIVNSKISEIKVQNDLKKSLGKLKSLVKFHDDTATLNEKRIEILRKLAGRFLIVTNTDLPVDQIVSSYKEQWMIERSFRTIKSFIEIRPVYHRKSERIRAHVFVCVLSLLLSLIMEKKAKTTMRQILESLSQLKAIPVNIPGTGLIIRTGSEDAYRMLSLLGVPVPKKVIGDTLTTQP